MRAPRQTEWLDDYMAVRLMAAGAAARRDLHRTLRRRRTPLREVMIVAVVHDHPGISPAAVADRLGLQRAVLSHLLPELVEEGLLDWPAKRGDARGRALHEAPAGTAFLAEATPALDEVERRLVALLTPTSRARLRTCLDELRGGRWPRPA